MSALNMRDYVVSSRVRLARNVSGLPFPHKMQKKPAEITAAVAEALKPLGKFEVKAMEGMGAAEANMLMEKHLISPALRQRRGGAAVIGADGSISVMVNEEDHIRAQCIKSGWDLQGAYAAVDRADDAITARLPVAFDARLGYLTACPTNLGTGMRASAMMFLPGLTMLGGITEVIQSVARLNMTVRGVYGEGSKAEGYLYQVSNQKSLGLSEKEIISLVENTVTRIADVERQARENLLVLKEAELRDSVLRALGTLLYSYTMESKEFIELASLVKLGAFYGFIRLSNSDALEKLITDAQPGCLAERMGGAQSREERDVFRSAFVAKEMRKIAAV